MTEFITLKDYLLFPVYIYLLHRLAKYLFKRFQQDSSEYKLFIKGFYIKLFGAFAISMIYRYYYHEGDTFHYFKSATIINDLLFNDFTTYVKIVFGFNQAALSQQVDAYFFEGYSANASTAIMIIISSLLSLVALNTYLNTAMLFAFISFCSSWYFYKKISFLYPELKKYIFYAIFFMPSIVVWGSGIFKDTLTLSLLLILTGRMIQDFSIAKKWSFSGVVIMAICAILIYNIKIYIIISFLPFAMWYILQQSLQKISSAFIRNTIMVFLLLIVVKLIFDYQDQISTMMQAYALDTLKDRIKTTYEWITTSVDNGSVYNLGDIDFSSWSGIISKFPSGVNVTLFRPYPWEAGKVIIMISALESFLTLLITVYVFLKTGIIRSFRKILSDKTVFLLFGFSMVFAFMVGISTGNFGSLVRYKLPIIPFFLIVLVVLYSQRKKANQTIPQ